MYQRPLVDQCRITSLLVVAVPAAVVFVGGVVVVVVGGGSGRGVVVVVVVVVGVVGVLAQNHHRHHHLHHHGQQMMPNAHHDQHSPADLCMGTFVWEKKGLFVWNNYKTTALTRSLTFFFFQYSSRPFEHIDSPRISQRAALDT